MFSLTYFLFGFATANSLAPLSSDGNASTIMQNSTEALPAAFTPLPFAASLMQGGDAVLQYQKDIVEQFVALYNSDDDLELNFHKVMDAAWKLRDGSNDMSTFEQAGIRSLQTHYARVFIANKSLDGLKAVFERPGDLESVIREMKNHIAEQKELDQAILRDIIAGVGGIIAIGLVVVSFVVPVDKRLGKLGVIVLAELFGTGFAVFGLVSYLWLELIEWTPWRMLIYFAPFLILNTILAFKYCGYRDSEKEAEQQKESTAKQQAPADAAALESQKKDV